MKEYTKPEIEIIKFGAEPITAIGEGEDGDESFNLDNDGWGN